jgi:hypothetical protein
MQQPPLEAVALPATEAVDVRPGKGASYGCDDAALCTHGAGGGSQGSSGFQPLARARLYDVLLGAPAHDVRATLDPKLDPNAHAAPPQNKQKAHKDGPSVHRGDRI